MLTISLMIDGKEKNYTARGITLRASYDAYDIYRRYTEANGDYTPELLEECADLVVRIFGGAFTREQLETGYMGSAFRLYPGILSEVVGYSNDTIANFPQPATAPAAMVRAGI